MFIVNIILTLTSKSPSTLLWIGLELDIDTLFSKK